MRVGIGFDIHRLAEGEGVILGGVRIPFNKRLVGHSDGDALCHAVIDALLGAAALGDIGRHYPDTDPKYKDSSSIEFLRQISAEVRSAGYRIGNVDAVVIAEAPRLSKYRDAMRKEMADAMGIEVGRVGLKGKTAEGLGPIGANDAICVQAVALLEDEG